MKKSDFVTKYDYINYYIKQPSMWFFKNSEIKSAYDLQIQKIISYNQTHDFDSDEEDEEVETEQDDYDTYRELLEENSQIDENNPLIASGLIIDQQSKEFIKQFHFQKYQCDFHVVDFDLQQLNLLACAKECQNLLQTYENIILFQPVFIDKKHQILTKCDALVKYQNELYLIETKATSSAKFHHLLDLFFQKQVLEVNFDPNKFDINYQLCLVKYEYLPAKQVSFIISDTINLTKSVTTSSIKHLDLATKQLHKLGASYIKYDLTMTKAKEIEGNEINPLLDLNSEVYSRDDLSTRQADKLIIVSQMINDFEKVISELWKHKSSLENQEKVLQDENKILLPGDFLPHQNDKSVFKTTDMWMELRYLYSLKGFKVFKYSGKVMDQSAQNLMLMTQTYLSHLEVFPQDYVKGIPETKEKYLSLYFAKNSADFFIAQDATNSILDQLKPKRVYFDFETINPAIRVVNHSLPFMQIVTQCSILLDHGNGIEDVCLNLMADPSSLTIDFFKGVVNSLYYGNEYSYVVYNKTFERSRLLEMVDFINDDEYTKKINVIVNNLFDLADFFIVTKDKQAVFIKELGGFYSIKKVLPLVKKYAPQVFEQTKCADYNDLNIHNGLICQTKSLARFYNNVDDKEWDQIVNDSKIYCENDVRAMVAVLYWVLDHLLKDPKLPHY